MSDDTQYLPPDPDVPRYQGRPLHDETQVLPPVLDEPLPTRASRRSSVDPAAAQEARRRRNSLALVAVAAVACLVGVALAFNALGGGSGSGGDDAPVAQQATGGAAPAAGAPTDLVMFRSPSANIGCSLSVEGARCDIAQKSWRPPAKPDSCQGDWGAGLRVGPSGAEVVCATDTVLGEGETLAYGQSQQRGDFRCISSREGMRCENAGGQGFTIARAAFTTF